MKRKKLSHDYLYENEGGVKIFLFFLLVLILKASAEAKRTRKMSEASAKIAKIGSAQ
jgi:hypothetical protein